MSCRPLDRINSDTSPGFATSSGPKILTIPASTITTSLSTSTTTTFTTNLPAMQIEVKVQKALPARTISNSKPRKAPSPPGTNSALSTRSTILSRTKSQDTLQHESSEKDLMKGSVELIELEDTGIPLQRFSEGSTSTRPSSSLFEVEALRSKVELLELRLEEMTLKVHVPSSSSLR